MSSYRYSIRTVAPRRSLFSFGNAIKLLLLVAVICVAGWLLFQHTVHSKLHGVVQTKIQEQLAPLGMGMVIGDARFTEGKGLTLDNIDLYLAANQYGTSIPSSNLQVTQLQVHSHSSLTDLASGLFKPEAIEIHRAKLQVVRGTDGKFDFSPIVDQLSQLSPGGPIDVAPVLLRDSEVEIVSLDQSLPTVVLSGVNFTVSPVQFQGQPLLHVQGALNTQAISKIEISLFINQQTKTWNAQLSADRAIISRDFAQSLPPSVASQFEPMRNLSGEVSFSATASGNDRFDQLPTFELSGRVEDFSIDDSRLPVAIAGLSTTFLVNNDGIVVKNAKGVLDQSTDVNLTFTQVGLYPKAPWRCVGNVKQFVFDDRPRLTAWFAKSIHKFANDFAPIGKCNVAFDLSHDGNHLMKKISGDITDMSFSFIKMPYRVDHCTGKVFLTDEHCDFSLESTINDQAVGLTGYADKMMGHGVTYRINLDVPANVPLDEKLLTATDAAPKLSRVIRAFNPRGFVSGRGVIERSIPQGPVNKWFDIRLNSCSVRHNNFPYPIRNVGGQVLVNNSNYEFKNLFGNNSNGVVKCGGNWGPVNGLDLTFQCRSVPLDDQLRQALQPEIQEIWDGFRPRGTMDQLDVFMRMPIGKSEVDLQVEATFPQSDDESSSHVSIFPIWFPYQINHFAGKLVVGQGRIDLINTSGRHQKTHLACEGQGRYSDTDWSLRLQNLLVTSLQVDKDLLAAVPKSMALPLAQLRFEGLANVNGNITLAGAKINNEFTPTPGLQTAHANHVNYSPNGRLQQASHTSPAAYNPPESSMAWDVRINTNQANMLVGLPLKNVFGGVRLTGIYDGKNIDCRGQLDLDSMTIYDNQVTQVTGPFRIDNQRVTAGVFVEKFSHNQDTIKSLQTVDSNQAQSLSGILHKGIVRLDAHMNTSGKNDFFVQSTIADGCIATTCRQHAPDLKNVTGHSFAVLKMTGDASGTHSYRGDGKIQVRDAQIYELPVFLSLLKLLNVRQLTRTAFDSGDIDFKVLGERIVFERMEFIGDAISLLGDGEMNLDWDIDLNFYSVIGRNRFNIPLISQLYRAGSQRTLAIKVDGKLDDPKTHSEVLPELNENIRRLFNSETSIADRLGTPLNQPFTSSRSTGVGQNFFQQATQQPVRIKDALRR